MSVNISHPLFYCAIMGEVFHIKAEGLLLCSQFFFKFTLMWISTMCNRTGIMECFHILTAMFCWATRNYWIIFMLFMYCQVLQDLQYLNTSSCCTIVRLGLASEQPSHLHSITSSSHWFRCCSMTCSFPEIAIENWCKMKEGKLVPLCVNCGPCGKRVFGPLSQRMKSTGPRAKILGSTVLHCCTSGSKP